MVRELFRPLDIHVGELIFYRDSSSSFFFLLSFFRHVPSELAERNSTKIGHMVGSECDLKTHVRNLGYPFPLQIGGPKTNFLDDFATQRQLATYIFRTKHGINNQANALTTIGLLHRLKMTWTLSSNGFKLEASFHPPSIKSAFHFIARLCRRRSANRT